MHDVFDAAFIRILGTRRPLAQCRYEVSAVIAGGEQWIDVKNYYRRFLWHQFAY